MSLSITTQNPQANGIIERIHKTIGNIICTFYVHKVELDKEEPWSGILGAIMFATRVTHIDTGKIIFSIILFDIECLIEY